MKIEVARNGLDDGEVFTFALKAIKVARGSKAEFIVKLYARDSDGFQLMRLHTGQLSNPRVGLQGEITLQVDAKNKKFTLNFTEHVDCLIVADYLKENFIIDSAAELKLRSFITKRVGAQSDSAPHSDHPTIIKTRGC